jgi:hypothetical protein
MVFIKRIRVGLGEPVIVAGKYRITVLRRGQKDEWKVETLVAGTTESVEVLRDEQLDIDNPPTAGKNT